MKTTILAFLTIAPLALFGCGNSTTTDAGTDGSTNNTDLTTITNPDMTPPAAPQLGTQIERMGRPTLNVAVTNPFDLDLSKVVAGNTGRDVTRDLYNADSDPTKWAADWSPILAFNLGIYDGADGTCGNQLLAGATAVAGRYNTLATVLADDQIYLDTTQTTCGFYLAVEANFALHLGLADCGGRTPLESVVNETYTFATVGVGGLNKDGSFAVTDGPTKNNEAQPNLTTFPFLGAAN
jgi:hypothetical protein